MSTTQQLVFTQCLEKENYYEYRYAELTKWLLTSNVTPAAAKSDIRKFYDHFLKFMKYDIEVHPYGIQSTFECEKIIFIKEESKEIWGTIELKSF